MRVQGASGALRVFTMAYHLCHFVCSLFAPASRPIRQSYFFLQIRHHKPNTKYSPAGQALPKFRNLIQVRERAALMTST
jgi:hypothetical protein